MPLWNATRYVRSLWALVALGVLAPSLLFGQTATSGTIVGHVRGPGGVSVPGATVQLTNPQTGERKETWTDEAGNYTFNGLNPGSYRLAVSLVGFRPDLREPVPVSPGTILKVNVALVFAMPEGGAPQPAQTGARPAGNPAALPGERLGRQQSPSDLENSPGEGVGPGGGAGAVRIAEGAGMENPVSAEPVTEEVDTSTSAANSFLLAGGTGNVPAPGEEGGRGGRGRMPGGPQEMAPGFGGGGFGGGPGGGFGGGPGGGFDGGPMMMGGGARNWGRNRAQVNRIRGNMVEQYTNSAFDAHPYPLNVAESPQIPSYRETFGFSLGGPLVIPKVYHGRDKTSFFVSYNLQRAKNPFNSFASVPTVEERGGDFSDAVIASGTYKGTVPVIYNPQSNPPGPRTLFAGNIIPPEHFNSAAVGLLEYIPLPNLPGTVQNFHLQESLPSASDRLMVRIGQQFNSKDSLNAMYFFNSARSHSVSSFPQLTSQSSTRSQDLNLSATHTFDPHLVNTLSLNFNRQRVSTLNPFAFQDDIAARLGIQGVSDSPFDWGIPIIQFTNFGALNDTIPSLTRNQTVRAFDFLIWNHGKHNVRLGGELRRVQLNTLTDPNARGTFAFSGYTTSDFSGGFPVPGTGIDFADFLLGLPQITSVRFGIASNYLRTWVTSAFLQDDWRVGAHLTVQYGLRYEYFLPFTEKYGRLSDLAFTPGFASTQVVTGLAPGSLPASLIHSDANNLAPRLGLAYRPWTQHHLVLRSGYSIFYDGSIYSRVVPNLVDQPPFAQASTLTTNPQQVLTLENGFPTIAPTVAHNTYAADSNFRTPYAQTWNFSLEDEIARNVVLSVGYVGTKGTKLDLLLSPNSANPNASNTGQQLSIQDALQFLYETSGASSIYNGLQVSLRRQYHSGFSMSGNYTYGKSIDDAAGVGGAGRTVAQNSFDLRAERGLSTFDVRHRLIINHTYELPFGERRRFLNRGGAAARVLGDWQISGVTTLQTGTPFTAQVLGNQSNNSGTGAFSSQRANATDLAVSLPRSERTTQEFFNTAAFALPASGEFGNAGRNTIPGPGTVNFNMSLTRFITFSREKNLRGEFRIEGANIFNTPNFGGLATVVNAQDFGRVTSVKAMRALTLTLRVRF